MNNKKVAKDLLKIAKRLTARNWKYRWNRFRNILHETIDMSENEITDEIISDVSKKLSKYLNRVAKQIKDEDDRYDIEDIAGLFGVVDNVDEFDELLEQLYDWADRADVWLGL